MRLFRIERKNLYRLWAWTSVSAALVFIVLAWLDSRLRSLTGWGTYELQQFSTAAQYRTALSIWIRPDIAMRAGFNLGLDYLLMPLYATAFFCSGLVAQDYFVAKIGVPLRRVLAIATLVPPLGALLDAVENGLELYLLNLARADDGLAQIAFRLSHAKMVCLYIGIALLLAALLSLVLRRAAGKPSPL